MTVAGPVAAALDAVNVSVLVGPAADAGSNVAVTPAGNPLAPSTTAAANPPIA